MVLEHSGAQLFAARTQALHSGFATQDEDLAVVSAICRHLDGVPLVIERAEARAVALGLPQVLSRLDDRFGLLAEGRWTALPRHQTLGATLDGSYELPPDSERHLLRFLGVHAAGFTLDARSTSGSSPSA